MQVDIKKIREIHGLTQKELAEKTGRSVSTIQQWESGAIEKISPANLKMLELLGYISMQVVPEKIEIKILGENSMKKIQIFRGDNVVDHLTWKPLKNGQIRFENGGGHMDWDEVDNLARSSEEEEFHLKEEDRQKILKMME